MGPVFIVGCAKTGSKLIRRILMTHPDVNILDELHYLVPRWVKEDFVHKAKHLGPLAHDQNVHGLVKLMFSDQLNGGFWRVESHRELSKSPGRIDDIDPEKLELQILQSDRSFGSILQVLMDEHTAKLGRRISGAKFPVSVGYTPQLVEWFPNCQIIHLVRDPRAIYTSMIKMSVNRSSASILRMEFPAKLVRLLYSIHQFRQTGAVHQRYKGSRQYHLLKFEDLVTNPQSEVKRLCEFLSLEFMPEMLNPPTGRGSNYDDKVEHKHGFDADTLERWKDHIPALGRKVLEVTLREQIAMFDYS